MPLSPWSLDPSLVYVGLAAGLYVLGSRGRDRPRPLQALAFSASLLTIVIALDSPIDYYADQLFWVHMVQHVLLLTVAPPLLLFGTAVAANVARAAARAADEGRPDDGTFALGGAGARARTAAAGVDPVQRHDHRLAHPCRV